MQNLSGSIGILGLMAISGPLHAAATGDPNFQASHYTGSGLCADCHDGLTDSSGNDISIRRNWESSMMANAARDPYWRAKVAAELKRNPTAGDIINDACSACHAPMANDSAKKDGAPVQILGSGFTDPANPYFNHAMDGVSCSFCHQMADTGNLGTLEGSSGHFTVLQYPNAVDRPAYGQYSSVNTGPMRNNVQFTPQFGAHMGTSELCATCHDLKTPFLDANGNAASTTLESEFPEQMVYSEWKHSLYAQSGIAQRSCQSCHMPTINDAVKISTRPPRNLPTRTGFRQHTFNGANTTMMGILDANASALGVLASSGSLNQAISDTRNFLTTAASMDITNLSLNNGQLVAQVAITNHTGHKLPSGYPSRRVYIHFSVEDSNGNIVFESGKPNADGSIAGADVDSDSTTYERHHDVITSPSQVQIYGPIMGDTDGNVTHTLLRAANYLKDNRLTPAGFDKFTAPNDVRVAGDAQLDPDFNDGKDHITYQINVGDLQNVTVRAELRYQTLSYGHLQDLFQDSDLTEVATFKAMFDNASIRDEIIASTSQSIALSNQTDSDGDGIADTADNCPATANVDQLDTNSDGFGNACDPDVSNDNLVNFADLGQWKAEKADASLLDNDFNGDGARDFADLAIMQQRFFGQPGS